MSACTKEDHYHTRPSYIICAIPLSFTTPKTPPGCARKHTGDLCNDSVAPTTPAATVGAATATNAPPSLHTRGHPIGASFCATKHSKRRLQAPPVPTLPAAAAASAAAATSSSSAVVVHKATGSSTSSSSVSAGGADKSCNGSNGAVDKAAIYGRINVADDAEQWRQHQPNRRCTRRVRVGDAADGTTVADDDGVDDDDDYAIESIAPDGGAVFRAERRRRAGGCERNKFSGSLPNHLDAADGEDGVAGANNHTDGNAGETAMTTTNMDGAAARPVNVGGRSICCCTI